MAENDLDEVIRRELRLLDPAVRADVEETGKLLHVDFLEFGKSGQVWNRDSILRAMSADPAVSGAPSGFTPTQLSADVVLVTYRSADGTRRGSIWVRDPTAGWLLRFHQGTPAA